MNKVLVKFNYNISNEFKAFGFDVITYEQLGARIEEATHIFNSDGNAGVYIFGDECITFDSYTEWFNTITLVGITDAEADFIINTFGSKVGQLLWL